MGAQNFGSIQQCIVYVRVEVSEPSIFYIFQKNPKSHIQFRCTFQIFEKKI